MATRRLRTAKHAQILIDESRLQEANWTDVPVWPDDWSEIDATQEPMNLYDAPVLFAFHPVSFSGESALTSCKPPLMEPVF